MLKEIYSDLITERWDIYKPASFYEGFFKYTILFIKYLALEKILLINAYKIYLESYYKMQDTK